MRCRGLARILLTVAVANASGCGETAPDATWPEFALLEEADYEHTYSAALSADGAVVSVYASPFAFDGLDTIGAQIWRADGVQSLELPGAADMISADGSLLAGYRQLDLTSSRGTVVVTKSEPFLFEGSDARPFPEVLRGFHPRSMTADGGTFTGLRSTDDAGDTRVPAVWTIDGAAFDLERPSQIDGLPAQWPLPLAISPDGGVVVGNVSVVLVEPPPVSVSESRAARWDGASIELLKGPDGAVDCLAADVSRGGGVVVGSCSESRDTGSGRVLAVVWANGQARRLPELDRLGSMRADLVSDDGLVVAGRWFSETGSGIFLWTATNGATRLDEILADAGHVDGLSFDRLAGLSADGRVLAGNAVDAAGWRRAFRAEVSP